MEAIGHSSNERYAIIQASSMKDHPERLVIAYPDENCLRDLIAGPSIVGLGFTSREGALGKLADRDSSGALKQKHHPTSMSCETQQKRDSAHGRGCVLTNRTIGYRLLQYALSTVTVLFYSKNLASVIIRMALGIS
jgi:hypothetical protein